MRKRKLADEKTGNYEGQMKSLQHQKRIFVKYFCFQIIRWFPLFTFLSEVETEFPLKKSQFSVLSHNITTYYDTREDTFLYF